MQTLLKSSILSNSLGTPNFRTLESVTRRPDFSGTSHFLNQNCNVAGPVLFRFLATTGRTHKVKLVSRNILSSVQLAGNKK